jgi:dTMP kinase
MEILSNFAVFEGGDGSGTTTQLAMLGERMKNVKKPPFFPTFEPFNNESGDKIRAILKKERTVPPEELCRLFADNRKEHLYGEGGVVEHVKKGFLAVSDRYVLSSLVYQGIECGDGLPNALNAAFPAPEITIFFDIEPETALERMKGRDSLEIYEYLDFQKKVRAKYKSVLETYRAAGARTETIDASKSPAEIAGMVWSIISQMPIFK